MRFCTLMLQEQFPSTHVTSSDNSLCDCRAGHVRDKEYVLNTFYLLNQHFMTVDMVFSLSMFVETSLHYQS